MDMKRYAWVLMVLATASIASAELIDPGEVVVLPWAGAYGGGQADIVSTKYWDLTQGDIKVSYSLDFTGIGGLAEYLNFEMISDPGSNDTEAGNPEQYEGEMIRARLQQQWNNASVLEKYLMNNVHGNWPAPSPARPGDTCCWQDKWSFADKTDTSDPKTAFDNEITDPGNCFDGIYGTYNGTTWYNANADTTAGNWSQAMGTLYEVEIYLHYNEDGVDFDKDPNYAADQRASGTYYDLKPDAKVPNVAYLRVNGQWIVNQNGERCGFDFHTGSDYLTPQLTFHEPSATPTLSPYISDITVEQVPEPATLSVLALGGLAALIRRRR
jgi:hypothetical protein